MKKIEAIKIQPPKTPPHLKKQGEKIFKQAKQEIDAQFLLRRKQEEIILKELREELRKTSISPLTTGTLKITLPDETEIQLRRIDEEFWDNFYQGVKQTLDSGRGRYNISTIPQRHGKVIFMKEAIKQYQKEHPEKTIHVATQEDLEKRKEGMWDDL